MMILSWFWIHAQMQASGGWLPIAVLTCFLIEASKSV